MTKRGHFIINGVPRVIINQIIRQAGVYHQQAINKIIKADKVQIDRRFFIDLISHRGAWLRLEIDRRKKIWVRMKKAPRIPALLLLQSIGLNKKTLVQTFLNFQYLNNKDSYSIKPLVDLEISRKKNSEDVFESRSKFFCRRFLNPKAYDLGERGRYQLNHRLGLFISMNQTTLTPYDLLWSIDSLIKLSKNQKNLDDIDNLKNRRIRTSGELIQNQLNLGLIRLEKIIVEKLKKSKKSKKSKNSIKLNHIFTSKSLNGVFKEFFGSNPLSQFLDQANPLAELTHKRRLTSVGPGGINRDTAGMAIRGIHSTHYGRICPIETPEGQNAGLVNSLTTLASKDKYGFLKTPFFLLYKGQIQKKLGVKIVTPDAVGNYSTALNKARNSKLDFLPKIPLTAQNQQLFKKLSRNSIDFTVVSYLQLISAATSLIPFLEHNDANRALMGSNMQRQAVPLINPERPLIGTALESRVLFFCGNFLQSKNCGIAIYTSHREVEILSFLNSQTYVSKILDFKNCFLPKLKFNRLKISRFLDLKNKNFKGDKFYFQKFEFLAKKSLSERFGYFYSRKIDNTFFSEFLKFWSFKVIIYPKLKTELLNFISFLKKRNKLKNIYFQLNFKIFQKRRDLKLNHYFDLVRKESTFRKNKIKSYFRKKSNEEYNIFSSKLTFKDYERSNQGTCLIQKPIIQANQWIEKGDLLTENFSSNRGELALGKNVLVAYLSWEGYNFEDALLINEKLIFDDFYTSLHIEKYKIESRETPYGFEEITKQTPSLDYQNTDNLDARGIIKVGSWVEEGDILVGRITPMRQRALLPHEKLLYDIMGKEISSMRDTSLRIPKGVEGRIIEVQVKEIRKAFQGKISTQIQNVCVHVLEYKKIKIGDKIAGRHGNKGIVSKILNQADMPYYPDGQPIDMILNPLGVPSRMNVGQIFESVLGFIGKKMHKKFKISPFDEFAGYETSRSLAFLKLYEARLKLNQNWFFSPMYPSKFRLFDGRTGDLFNYSIMAGFSYMMKLIHLVDEKIHARSTGSYSLVTQQPLRGRSKHGGQRFGEMEVWALEGFGVAYTLQELLTVKSDDVGGRMQIMEAILKNTSLKFGTPESFKVLIRELQALCLDVQVYNKNIDQSINYQKFKNKIN